MEKNYDILTLDDNMSYVNLEEITYQDEVYMLLVLLDEEENPTEEYTILKKVVISDSEYELEEIDEALHDTLMPIFQENFRE